MSPHEQTPASSELGENRRHSPTCYLCATLSARIYQILPLLCPKCGDEMRLIAFNTEDVPFRRILEHVWQPARSPPATESFGWNQSTVHDPERSEPAPVRIRSNGELVAHTPEHRLPTRTFEPGKSLLRQFLVNQMNAPYAASSFSSGVGNDHSHAGFPIDSAR